MPGMNAVRKTERSPEMAGLFRKYGDGFPAGDSWYGSVDERRTILHTVLGWADAHRGTDAGAISLLVAARAHVGACARPDLQSLLEPSSYDSAAVLYQRVIDEYPGTWYANQARWGMAFTYGNWVRYDCCYLLLGKRDYGKAASVFRQLYDEAGNSETKRDALCRLAEVLSMDKRHWREGLGAWKRALAEYRELSLEHPLPRSSEYVTVYGDRGPATLAFTILQTALYAATHDIKEPGELPGACHEFIELAPRCEAIRTTVLRDLADKLSSMGDAVQAGKIRDELGFCNEWLFVGPFSGDKGGPAEGRELDGVLGRQDIPEGMKAEIRSSYQVEKDVLSGGFDPAKAYTATPATKEDFRLRERGNLAVQPGTEGRASWLRTASPGPVANDLHAIGTFYAYVLIESEADADGLLRMGYSGHLKAWVNGGLALCADRIPADGLPDDFVVPLRLHKGPNPVLVKLTPLWSSDCYLRVTGSEGRALPGIRYAVPPVPESNLENADFLKPGRRG